jgi:hypothetical protein
VHFASFSVGIGIMLGIRIAMEGWWMTHDSISNLLASHSSLFPRPFTLFPPSPPKMYPCRPFWVSSRHSGNTQVLLPRTVTIISAGADTLNPSRYAQKICFLIKPWKIWHLILWGTLWLAVGITTRWELYFQWIPLVHKRTIRFSRWRNARKNPSHSHTCLKTSNIRCVYRTNRITVQYGAWACWLALLLFQLGIEHDCMIAPPSI